MHRYLDALQPGYPIQQEEKDEEYRAAMNSGVGSHREPLQELAELDQADWRWL